MSDDTEEYLVALGAILTSNSNDPVDLEFVVRSALGREPSNRDVQIIRELMGAVRLYLEATPIKPEPGELEGAEGLAAPEPPIAAREANWRVMGGRVMGKRVMIGDGTYPSRVMPNRIMPGWWDKVRERLSETSPNKPEDKGGGES